MMLRSMLFIPGDSAKKLGKADSSNADAIILDLEDSVIPARKKTAREMVSAFLGERDREHRSSELWVRINPLGGPEAMADLAAIVPGVPDGIMLPKADGPEDVRSLSDQLDALEADAGVAAGCIKVLPIATETPIAPFRLADYATAGLSRLVGLTWGAEDLSSALGASTSRDGNGEWAFTYKLVRSLTLLAASAADVQAIETVYTSFRDSDGLAKSCREARAEGFNGRLAIHPDQVDVINRAFLPSAEEADLAKRILAAFAAEPGAGAVGIDGTMYDLPHLNQARNTLALYEAHSRPPAN